MSLKIIGIGKGIPKRKVSNNDLCAFLDTSDEWITTRTGIKNRYICTTESMLDLSETAAAQAIKKANLKSQEIDLIICSTICGDFVTPSLACAVQERIKAKCPAFDVNAACSGFIYALELASLYISAGKVDNILIVCAEMMSKHADWSDRSTCVLFGDGAGACVVTRGDALRYTNLSASGETQMISLSSACGNNPFVDNKTENRYLRMNGPDVYKFAVSAVEKEAGQALQEMGLAHEDVTYYILHQANKRIIDAIRAKIGLPERKFPVNIEKYGNVSSASIPILLDEMIEADEIKPGDTLFLCAFGAGMTVGSCILVWE